MANESSTGQTVQARQNTDRELWREIALDPYSASVHVTVDGGIGISVDGLVIVRSPRDWHALTSASAAKDEEIAKLREFLKARASHLLSCPAMPVSRVVPDGWVGDEFDGGMTYRTEMLPRGECNCGLTAALSESR